MKRVCHIWYCPVCDEARGSKLFQVMNQLIKIGAIPVAQFKCREGHDGLIYEVSIREEVKT